MFLRCIYDNINTANSLITHKGVAQNNQVETSFFMGLLKHPYLHFQKVIREGYAASQVLSQFHDRVIAMDDLSDKQKSVICEKMAVSRPVNFSTCLTEHSCFLG